MQMLMSVPRFISLHCSSPNLSTVMDSSPKPLPYLNTNFSSVSQHLSAHFWKPNVSQSSLQESSIYRAEGQSAGSLHAALFLPWQGRTATGLYWELLMLRGNTACCLQDKCFKRIKHFYSRHTIKALFSPLFKLRVDLRIRAIPAV